MKDYWELKKLFKFSRSIKLIYNDTNETVSLFTKSNQEIILKPNCQVDFGLKDRIGQEIKVNNNNYDIVNIDIYKYSNKKLHKAADFNENLNNIFINLTTRLNEGQIIEGIRFLNYHYKWTKYKKRYLQFIKYYVKSKSWIEFEKREKYSMNDWAIEDWIKEKERAIERPKNILLLIFLILIFTTGILFLVDYRNILIGALIGIIAAKFDKLVDLIFKRQ